MALQQRKKPSVWGLGWTADELRSIVKRHYDVTEDQLYRLEHHELAELLNRLDSSRSKNCRECGQLKT